MRMRRGNGGSNYLTDARWRSAPSAVTTSKDWRSSMAACRWTTSTAGSFPCTTRLDGSSSNWPASPSGGVGIVAAVAGPPPRIVGEADYALPNGDGELAVTVVADWRGWLGPLLLEALVQAAAARGVPNLEAEILVENRPMLALVRNRGFATLDHADYSVIRVLLGTHSSTPTWPGPHDRPRLLIEIPGGRWRGEEAARRAGWSVVTCPGPRPGAIPHCPVVAGGRCPLADGADVVLSALDPAQPGGAAVREGHSGAGHAAVIPLGRDTSPLNLQADDATIVAALDELRSS